jgi:thiamine phosphate synthase YjbQ (UPF0047 family)
MLKSASIPFLLRQAAAPALLACYHRDARKPSGGLSINENADPDVLRVDMETIFSRLVPEN